MSLHLETLRIPERAETPSGNRSPADRVSSPSPRFSELVQRFTTQMEGGERLVQDAVRRNLGALDASALIAVQAGIYRYTELVDLAGKLVDRATGAVKQVLQPGGH